MPLSARIALLTLCLAPLLVIGFLGLSFSMSVNPELPFSEHLITWGIVGAIATLPFWLPAIVPTRFPAWLTVIRAVAAFALLLEMLLIGPAVVEAVLRLASGHQIKQVPVFVTFAFVASYIGGFVLISWPYKNR